MRIVICVCLLLASTMSIGCNSGPDNNEVIIVEGFNPVTELKNGLEGIKKTGRIGSSFGALQGHVIDIKKTDPAKAELLEKELKELASFSSDEKKAKAKAAEIISKL